MATSVTTASGAAVTESKQAPPLAWLIQWVKGHKQAAAAIGVFVGLGVILVVWNLLSSRTAERNASARLEQARLAVDSKNYPLAASELSQIIENYAGTRAAQQGALELAHVRLLQGQSQQAIEVLKKVAPGMARPFRAHALGLLGAAYENAAHPKEAAEAYQQAADAAEFPFLRAQFLSDAGRAWVAAGDTAKALEAYRTIATKLDSTSVATEAKVRIGELTRGAAAAAAK